MKFLLDEGLSPRVVGLLVDADHLDQLETTLTEGALVVIGDNRLRIRSLPIEPA